MAVRVETETHRAGKRRRMDSESSSPSLLQLEDLHEDALIEILCRVTNYKDMMRCKCVSKRWFSLISDPSFISRHRYRSMKKQRPWGFIYRSKKSRKIKISSKDSVFKSRGFSFTFLPRHQPQPVPMGILQTYNDLVLCSPFTRQDFHPVYYLCNPFTLQWVSLPLPPPRGRVAPEHEYSACTNQILVNLVCESYEEEHGVAMCRFNVVRVHRYQARYSTLELDIFSSLTRQWMKHNVKMLPKKPFPINMIIEVVTCKGTLFALAFEKAQIMALNLNSLMNTNVNGSTSSHYHDYHILQLPNVDAWRSIPVAYQGRLRLLHIKQEEDDIVPVLYVWELKEYYNNNVKNADSDCKYWSLVHRFSFAEMVVTNCREWFSENIVKTRLLPCDGGLRIIALNFQPDDGNVLCLSFNGRIASYDMWNKTLSFHPKTKSRSIWPMQSPFLQLMLPSCPTTIPKM